ncbi:MAG: RNA polymerase sigma factor [Rhodospirillaceae bacterium]|nr:RNA polymerase sigma factor [Rhodospirillaceae bacterium]
MQNAIRQEMVELVPRMRRFAYALTGSKDEGDDLVQAACARALGRLDQFQPGTRLDSWMFRIVQTIRLDRLRSQRHRYHVAAAEMMEHVSDGGAAARQVEARLTLDRLRAEMATLPDDQRAVLALVAIDGCSYRDAAEILDIPIGTVMSRLARARARLMGRMGELG